MHERKNLLRRNFNKDMLYITIRLGAITGKFKKKIKRGGFKKTELPCLLKKKKSHKKLIISKNWSVFV